jgi:hypothetical protein
MRNDLHDQRVIDGDKPVDRIIDDLAHCVAHAAKLQNELYFTAFVTLRITSV